MFRKAEISHSDSENSDVSELLESFLRFRSRIYVGPTFRWPWWYGVLRKILPRFDRAVIETEEMLRDLHLRNTLIEDPSMAVELLEEGRFVDVVRSILAERGYYVYGPGELDTLLSEAGKELYDYFGTDICIHMESGHDCCCHDPESLDCVEIAWGFGPLISYSLSGNRFVIVCRE